MHRRLGRLAQPSPSVLVVGAAMAAAAFLLVYWSRGEWFGNDDLGYAVRLATDPLGHTLLHPPPDKYLIAFPLLVYKALFETFGIDSYRPYRVTGILLVLLSAGLLFVLLRRWLPDRFAIPPTLLMLFFGAGSEVVVNPERIPSQMALAAGLGMMLALERRDRRGDLAAMVLLAISLASHPVGIAFTAAGAVMIILSSRDGWRRLWVIVIPGALFAAWWLFLRPPEYASFPNTPDAVFVFVRQSWVALTAAVSGLFGVLTQPAFHQTTAKVAALALLLLIALGIGFGRRRLPPIFWAALVGLVVLMATTRLAPAGFLRVPDEPRYLYPEAFFLLIALGVLAGSLKLPDWSMWAASAVLLVSLWPNIDRLHDAGLEYSQISEGYRVQWSAVEIAGPSAQPGFRVSALSPEAGGYLAAVRAFGPGGFTVGEIAGKSDGLRQVADVNEVAALGLRLEPATRPPRGGAPPRVADPQIATTSKAGCTTVRKARGAGPGISGSRGVGFILPSGGAWLGLSRPADADIHLGRFADGETVPLKQPAGAEGLELRIPPDQASIPWRLLIRSRSRITVCGLAPAGSPAGPPRASPRAVPQPVPRPDRSPSSR